MEMWTNRRPDMSCEEQLKNVQLGREKTWEQVGEVVGRAWRYLEISAEPS